MATDFLKLFTSLGLSKTETQVYLASFELGPTSVQEIAKKARISRTAAYEAIESLQKRSLLSTFVRGKKRFFSAEEPERALKHFKDSVSDMSARLDDFSRVLPEMKLLAGGERPIVRFYEGREAIFALFNDLAQSAPKRLDEVSNMADLYEFLDTDYVKEVRKVVDPSKMQTRILHRGEVKHEKRAYVEYAQLPDDLGNFHGDIWVYGNRVAFVAFVGKVMAVIIESEPFADTARVLFEAGWRMCKGKS
jgi:sugar-specific transcriptional regulator TrmB